MSLPEPDSEEMLLRGVDQGTDEALVDPRYQIAGELGMLVEPAY